jgi:hypothetical protein
MSQIIQLRHAKCLVSLNPGDSTPGVQWDSYIEGFQKRPSRMTHNARPGIRFVESYVIQEQAEERPHLPAEFEQRKYLAKQQDEKEIAALGTQYVRIMTLDKGLGNQ